MKRLLPLLAVLTLSSCTQIVIPPPAEDIHTDTSDSEISSDDSEHEDINEKINYSEQCGLWVPYVEYEKIMFNKSEDEFRAIIKEKFQSVRNEGINTVYVHAHPNGDAYYQSDYFPKGAMLDGDYDPLEIMLEEAHKLNISCHAWINPLRFQNTLEMEEINDDFIVKQWIDSPEINYVKKVNERWYLDPSYDETRNLICEGVKEILEKYDVDGIHIDDYFYPTTDEEFDRTEFTNSNADLLEVWRLDNITKMVKSIYDTVKEYGNGAVFGISPQGNIYSDYTGQYADVRLWGGNKGYCDYIVPQIYYGFKNSVCPFEETLHEWEKLVGDSGVSLVIGLGEYKIGKADMWAGTDGEREWIDNPDIINEQIEMIEESSANGYAFYR